MKPQLISASYLVERLCGPPRVAVECSRALLLDMPRLTQSGYAICLSAPHDDAKVRTGRGHLSANLPSRSLGRRLADIAGMSRRNFGCAVQGCQDMRAGSTSVCWRMGRRAPIARRGAPSNPSGSAAAAVYDGGSLSAHL